MRLTLAVCYVQCERGPVSRANERKKMKMSLADKKNFDAVNALVPTIDPCEEYCLIPFFKGVARLSDGYSQHMKLWGNEDANGGISANCLNKINWGFSYFFNFNGTRLALEESMVGKKFKLKFIGKKVVRLIPMRGDEGMRIF